MRWKCPACQAPIERRRAEDLIFGMLYRCPVCKLNLIFDSVTQEFKPVTLTDIPPRNQ